MELLPHGSAEGLEEVEQEVRQVATRLHERGWAAMDVREVDGTCHDTGRGACAFRMTRAAQARRESIRAASELFRHSRETEGACR